jgi:NAD(P)H-dependent FMN reductase
MLRIAIVIGSTRPGRVGEQVGRWVYDLAKERDDAEFELVDLAEVNLPLLDEPAPPMMGKYSKPHTKKWASLVDSFDAFVFVTPEYNHATSGALKNALDYLYAEWNDKAAGFVGYGSAGGTRAVENLRVVLAELQVATVRNQVALSLFDDFEQMQRLKPRERHAKDLTGMLDQLVAWGTAMKSVRESKTANA